MKKYILTAAVSLVATGVYAQSVDEAMVAESYTETITEMKIDFKSNWFISAGVGGQVFFGDHDRQASFGDRLSPALDIAVGKWFSPSIGVRLMYSGLSGKGATQTWGDPNGGIYNTGKEVPGKYTNPYGFLCQQKFNFFTLHADMMFDLTNIIGGYKPTRVYGCAPYIGVGWGHVYDNPHQNTVIGNVGVFNMFHVGKAIDINLDLRAMITNDDLDGELGRRTFDAMLSVTAGVTYRSHHVAGRPVCSKWWSMTMRLSMTCAVRWPNLSPPMRNSSVRRLARSCSTTLWSMPTAIISSTSPSMSARCQTLTAHSSKWWPR